MLLPLFRHVSDRVLLGTSAVLLLLPIPIDWLAGTFGVSLSAPAVRMQQHYCNLYGITEYNFGIWLRNAGKHNGVPGDLLVLIEEEKHPELIRDESDLIYNLLLSVPTAALGGTVEIPTIDGKAKIKIEPGTQPGKVLRLRGKGLPNINSYGYNTGTGDLLVNVSVYIPETLTKEERQALEKWQEAEIGRASCRERV